MILGYLGGVLGDPGGGRVEPNILLTWFLLLVCFLHKMNQRLRGAGRNLSLEAGPDRLHRR